MLTLEAAQAAIVESITHAGEAETVPLAEAAGRYLAQAVVTRVAHPGFDNSAMDGYAVALEQLQTNGFVLPLSGESSCGDAPGELVRETTMRIFTGAPLPLGADAVVIQEDVREENGAIVFPQSVQLGQNIRRLGEDFTEGESLYGPGHRLAAHDLALLSAAGIAEVPVWRRPRALVVSTGNELKAPGERLVPGQIYESNRLPTRVQLQDLGADVTDGGTVRDDVNAVRSMLEQAREYDFVITSGGVSVGDHDLVKQVFAEIGEINFWKVRVKPGKPVAFGRVGERCHFFGLPGNPVSSLVTFRLFIEPALLAWHHAPHEAGGLTARLLNDHSRHAGRTEFLRARLHVDTQGKLCARILSGQGSHMLGTMREANGLVRMEHDIGQLRAGDAVTVLPLTLNLPREKAQ